MTIPLFPSILETVPGKRHILSLANEFAQQAGDTALAKFATLKGSEFAIENCLTLLRPSAMEQFVNDRASRKTLSRYGVVISGMDYSKSAMLKDPEYSYSIAVVLATEKVAKLEAQLKEEKRLLKELKQSEIARGIAKRIDSATGEVLPPLPPKMVMTLRLGE